MENARAVDLNAAPAAQPQPKSQIDIFSVTEEAFIKTAQRRKGVAPVKRRGCAWREALAVIWQARGGLSKSATIADAENVEDVPRPVERVGIIGLQLRRSEGVRPRITRDSGQQRRQPVALRKGVRI